MDQEESFGERLRRVRRDRGFTLRKLAERVGVDYSYLSKLENEHLLPPADETIVRLAEALGIEPDVFFAVARKVPTDLRRRVREAPPHTALLLRKLSVSRLSEEQYRRIMDILEDASTVDENAKHGA
jgi:HTH-type transcriptional regulator, competence development regulator